MEEANLCKTPNPRCPCINFGIIDSGADITIMGGELFKKVAAAARLKKRDFKKADLCEHLLAIP